jgi:hypothetical protein
MKTNTKPSISKLVARFDDQLRNIIMQDLQAIKNAKSQLVNTISQAAQNNTLTAA